MIEEKGYEGEADEEIVTALADMAKREDFFKNQPKKKEEENEGDLHPGYCGPAPQVIHIPYYVF